MFTCLALVSPPVALALDVFARSLAEIGRADDDDLEALRPGLVATPRTRRDAHGRTESDSRVGRAGGSGRIARARAPRSPSGTPGPARRRTWTRRPRVPP